jgi:hypothetical protein
MSARQVTEFENEYGGEHVEITTAEPHGGLPEVWSLNVERRGMDKLILNLSANNAATVSGALLPENWWEALLRDAYRAGWAKGAEEVGGVDHHARDAVHPYEDDTVKALLSARVEEVRRR